MNPGVAEDVEQVRHHKETADADMIIKEAMAEAKDKAAKNKGKGAKGRGRPKKTTDEEPGDQQPAEKPIEPEPEDEANTGKKSDEDEY